MYSGSNDPSYMNHIICGHCNTNYRCGKCLKEVFTTGQLLKTHIKVCKGLPKEAANEATVGNVDCTHATPEKKKRTSKDPSPDLQPPPPQSSQGSSQVSLCQNQHAIKKPTLTPKKSDSSHREEECSSHHKHHGKDKSGEKSSTDKHTPKKSHKKSSKKPSKNSSKKSSKEKCHEKEKPGKEKQCNHDKTVKDKSSKSGKK